MKVNKNSYIRFLNCVETLKVDGKEYAIDSIENQLLDLIMIAHSTNREILVGDLLVLNKIASQATLHGRLKKLAKAGFIKLITDSVDGRKKKIIPARLAIQRYDKLSKLLVQSAVG